jgi:hypothetical protein
VDGWSLNVLHGVLSISPSIVNPGYEYKTSLAEPAADGMQAARQKDSRAPAFHATLRYDRESLPAGFLGTCVAPSQTFFGKVRSVLRTFLSGCLSVLHSGQTECEPTTQIVQSRPVAYLVAYRVLVVDTRRAND